ncbi:grainyhead-like protein 1 homolog [Mucor ambiguus]|uniref:Grainyhead-like protein 1 homolog n=1 Tax=Mucor ambiguus TaxID=91626 RepID=A0A0C9M440_9FUNG|nr:grainyhead-like protein 1 homolog [Mucor ambiguus]
MISSNQSTFPESTTASLFPDSPSYSIQEHPHQLYYHHQQQRYHRQSYYHSPSSTTTTTTINSPLSSPQILNHYSTTSSPYCSFTEPYPTSQSISSMLSISSPSPPSNCLPSSSFNQSNHSNASVIRYDVALEAPTAASQKLEEPPLTYLNKGQYYNITLKDKDRYDGDIISTVAITFHDESHRVSATDYWKFWLTQQKNGEDARAVELDLSRSNGAQAIEGRQFDRVSFRWNGKLGASVHIRFNCLSTDFSRIKGVKGIPLRLQIESEQAHPFVTATAATSHHLRQHHHHHPYIEKTYCRIKLFRDKGAERKNKDDAKHIERQLEKLRGKSGEPHPLWLAFSPTSPITLFGELVPPEDDEAHHQQLQSLFDERNTLPSASPIGGHITHHSSGSSSANNNIHLPPPVPTKRNFSNLSSCSSDMNAFAANLPGGPPIGLDPTYIPQRRRRVAIKFHSCEVYRAIYLEHLTVKELTEKIIQRMNITISVSKVLRKITSKNKKSILVKVEDDVIQDMSEQQDILLETEADPDNENAINLILNF